MYITIILNQSAGPIKAIFHRQHQYESGTNMCIKSRSHSQDGLHAHIMQKNRCPCKNGFINDNDNCRIPGVCGWDFYIKSFCFMCSPVEHYFCFYLISLLYDFEDVPRKNSFWRCPQKNDKLCPRENWFIFILVASNNDNRCPRKSGLSSLYYCLLSLSLRRARCLSFLLKLSRMTTLLGKS